MCTMSPIFPPPRSIFPLKRIPKAFAIKDNQSSTPPDICRWTENPELREACFKAKICLHEAPFRYTCGPFKTIEQRGNDCGLVALAMLINGVIDARELLRIAKEEGYTNYGEMFSCKDMVKMVDKVLTLTESKNIEYCHRHGGLFSKEIIDKLLDGATLLVPYDEDFNRTPGLRNGDAAHWALICGLIVIEDPGDSYESNTNNVYVLCRHGNSKVLVAWSLEQLEKSNKNLWQFTPRRGDEGINFVLPSGGVGGENGLRDQFILFEFV